jgi:hypothetical protein
MDYENTLAWRRYLGSITNYVQSMISQYVTALFVHSIELVDQIYCIYIPYFSWIQDCYLVFGSVTLMNYVYLVSIPIWIHIVFIFLRFCNFVELCFLNTNFLFEYISRFNH